MGLLNNFKQSNGATFEDARNMKKKLIERKWAYVIGKFLTVFKRVFEFYGLE